MTTASQDTRHHDRRVHSSTRRGPGYPQDSQDVETSSVGSQEDRQAETFDKAYVEKLRKEAAEHRVRAKRADELARQLLHSRVAALGKLADPDDLPYDEALLDDMPALEAAIEDLIGRKPHLAVRTPRGDIGQGLSLVVRIPIAWIWPHFCGPTFERNPLLYQIEPSGRMTWNSQTWDMAEAFAEHNADPSVLDGWQPVEEPHDRQMVLEVALRHGVPSARGLIFAGIHVLDAERPATLRDIQEQHGDPNAVHPSEIRKAATRAEAALGGDPKPQLLEHWTRLGGQVPPHS